MFGPPATADYYLKEDDRTLLALSDPKEALRAHRRRYDEVKDWAWDRGMPVPARLEVVKMHACGCLKRAEPKNEHSAERRDSRWLPVTLGLVSFRQILRCDAHCKGDRERRDPRPIYEPRDGEWIVDRRVPPWEEPVALIVVGINERRALVLTSTAHDEALHAGARAYESLIKFASWPVPFRHARPYREEQG